MTDCLSTDRLSKSFGKVDAVQDISLHVREGEIYGFLGLNGAGKTTTIRMLLGMIRPTTGSAYLYGQKVGPRRHDLWHSVGYLVEIPYSYPDLTVRENLEIVRRLRFITDAGCIDAILELLHLDEYRDRLTKDLSLGNAQRLGLAKALIHNPRILILDEPANGLDPAGIFEIRELLKRLAASAGVTVFISSHILGEISRFASRIGIVHRGRLIQEIDVANLGTLCERKLELNTRDNRRAISVLEKAGYPVAATDDGSVLYLTSEVAIDSPDKIASILVHADCPPLMLRVDEEDLESYFLRIIAEREEGNQ